MPRVQVAEGGAWDAELIEREPGVPPLQIEPVRAPVLLVDGRIEPDATRWLAEVHAWTAATGTAQTYTESLAQFVAHLVAANTSLRGATRRHLIDYVRVRTVDLETRVSGSTWARNRSAIKQFYTWLSETYGVALPFTLDTITTPRGPVASMRVGRGIAKASAAGTPLTLPQIPELLAVDI